MEIWDDCLFSYNVELRTSDSHSLLDGEGIKINPAKDVHIGNHVWIAQKSLVLKGAKIGNDSVVAAGSVVTGHEFPDNTLLIGSPARAGRENINWDIKRM